MSWLVDGVYEVLDAIASADIQPGGPSSQNHSSLWPTFGVGLGGQGMVRGHVIKALIEAAVECADKYDFDIAFVVANAADYAAYQSIRRGTFIERWYPSTGPSNWQIGCKLVKPPCCWVRESASPPDCRRGTVCSRAIRQKELPGVSSAGIRRAQCPRPCTTSVEGVAKRRTTDRTNSANVLFQLTGSDIKTKRCRIVFWRPLRVTKVVTTNYDSLYERAFESAHGENSVAVLPREEARAGVPWVLKLHGDVADSASIVLESPGFRQIRRRTDVRWARSFQSSHGKTGHLIVVGASMTDDNVLRLAHEVLALDARNKAPHEFWVPSSRCSETRFELLCGRTTSITLLFQILSISVWLHATWRYSWTSSRPLTSVDAPYLLDTRYKGLLEGGEIDLAENLRAAAGRPSDLCRTSTESDGAAWKQFSTN